MHLLLAEQPQLNINCVCSLGIFICMNRTERIQNFKKSGRDRNEMMKMVGKSMCVCVVRWLRMEMMFGKLLLSALLLYENKDIELLPPAHSKQHSCYVATPYSVCLAQLFIPRVCEIKLYFLFARYSQPSLQKSE